ncbi:MAG TPA: hypothetical protein DCE56_27585, partial [Cyanobacteria bacterium UBA8553]|nr:hypothetical protein [Cyanobacteria bacterium UBA8553]
ERQAVMEEAARRYNEIHRGSDKPVNPSSPNPRFPSDWIGIVDRVLSERFISKVRGEQAQENIAAQPAHIPAPEQLQLERKFLQSLPSEIKAKLGGEENYLSLVNYYPQLV